MKLKYLSEVYLKQKAKNNNSVVKFNKYDANKIQETNFFMCAYFITEYFSFTGPHFAHSIHQTPQLAHEEMFSK